MNKDNQNIADNVDIENIARHNNNHKSRTYTDEEYTSISAEFLKNIDNIKTNDDITKFQKHIQRTVKVSL